MGSWVKIVWVLWMVQTVAAELPDGVYAAFDTSMGSFTCRLDTAEAPLTCANFVGLAEGSQQWMSPDGAVRSDPFYDGLIFHRVIDGFMIQGGDPLGTGTGGPGYAFPDQISTNLTHHSAGILSMANSGRDSNGSQFFITLAPTSWLDGEHAVFGEVVDGMESVYAIGSTSVTNGSVPVPDVVMQRVRILRIGSMAAAFNPVDQPLPEVSALPVMLNGAVSVATSNQCEQFIFSSTNLKDWTNVAGNYTPAEGDDLLVPIATNQHCGFYRAAQIVYPQASTLFSNLEGQTIFFTQGTNTYQFSLEANELGTCDIAGTADTLTYWEEWTTSPYVARIVFQPSEMYAFQFVRSRSGACEGYQYSAFGWQYIGLWTFGKQHVIPE